MRAKDACNGALPPPYGGGEKTCRAPHANYSHKLHKEHANLHTAVQASRRPCKLADSRLPGLAPPETVGSVSGRHDGRVVRHQAQTATEHRDSATSRPPFDVL